MEQRDLFKFLYVSDGNPHKNHLPLLQAWEKVYQQDVRARLYITVSNNYPDMLRAIADFQTRVPTIINLGIIPRENLRNEYLSAQYVIYPSIVESFGLGLIEGADAGCQIIASDLPFVHSVVLPTSVFNPLNPDDIASAVIKTIANNSNNTRTQILVQDEIENLLALLS